MHSSRAAFSSLHTQQGCVVLLAGVWGFWLAILDLKKRKRKERGEEGEGEVENKLKRRREV